jgi:hypothetical protein
VPVRDTCCQLEFLQRAVLFREVELVCQEWFIRFRSSLLQQLAMNHPLVIPLFQLECCSMIQMRFWF